jgi:hypothetical protein
MSTVASPPTPITPTGEVKPLLSLTDAAVEKVKFFATSMPDSVGKPLRIFVQGGGCSGFQYGFQFDEKKARNRILRSRRASSTRTRSSSSLGTASTGPGPCANRYKPSSSGADA